MSADKPVSLAERISDLPDLMRDAGIAALEDQCIALEAEVKALEQMYQADERKILLLLKDRDGIEVRVGALVEELERERVRLAGAGVAAIGYCKEPVPEYGDSASLQDVLKLRKRADALDVALRSAPEEWTENSDEELGAWLGRYSRWLEKRAAALADEPRKETR